MARVSLDLCRRLKDKGALLLQERISTTAYAAASWTRIRRLGWPSRTDISDELIRQEYEENELADYIFSTGPFVDSSLVRHGVDPAQGVAVQLRVGSARFVSPPCARIQEIAAASSRRPFPGTRLRSQGISPASRSLAQGERSGQAPAGRPDRPDVARALPMPP